jgi:hypothetical protein
VAIPWVRVLKWAVFGAVVLAPAVLGILIVSLVLSAFWRDRRETTARLDAVRSSSAGTFVPKGASVVAEGDRCASVAPLKVLSRDFHIAGSVPAVFREMQRALERDGWTIDSEPYEQPGPGGAPGDGISGVDLTRQFDDWTAKARLIALESPEFVTEGGRVTSYALELSVTVPAKNC